MKTPPGALVPAADKLRAKGFRRRPERQKRALYNKEAGILPASDAHAGRSALRRTCPAFRSRLQGAAVFRSALEIWPQLL